MLNAINRFRSYKGKHPVPYGDGLVSHYCKLHCLAMARERDIFHAPAYYLNDWKEAVAMMSYNEHWLDRVIFDVLGTSPAHASIMLDCDTLACNYVIDNWMVYVCVRGR